ncbi:MAG: WYL domain-containing protein [Planctomycetales bacterium]|nr:WYL domain-containing protein [Planctomycetales bacterium]
MKAARITRLIRLLQALSSGDGKNADGLAAECGVSRRTIFRDLEALKTAGAPVHFDAERDCYAIAGAHFLPPTNFTSEEALAIICLASQATSDQMPPFLEAAHAAAKKLEASLPTALREQFQQLAASTHLRPTRRNPLTGKREVYQLLVDAQASRSVVKIEYESLTEWERITTLLRPYELLFSQRSWYVIGRSGMHKEVRTFNVGRIESAELTGDSFRRPKRFTLKGYLRNAWRIVPEEGPDSLVHLRFSEFVARNVAEVEWHPTQKCDVLEDGSLDYRVTVTGLNEISWWVLGYGDQVEVLAPQRLRKLISQRLASAVRIYQ